MMHKKKVIIFNTEMVRAINNGRKTETRRIVDIRDVAPYFVKDNIPRIIKKHAKYQVGDILWVREPAKVTYQIENRIKFIYLSDGKESELEIPKRFINGKVDLYQGLPKWIYAHQGVPNGCIKEMARTFLKVSNVRVEKLQDIHGGHIEKEGLPKSIKFFSEAREWWIKLWNSTSKPGYMWKDNPYIFVYEFKKVVIK